MAVSMSFGTGVTDIFMLYDSCCRALPPLREELKMRNRRFTEMPIPRDFDCRARILTLRELLKTRNRREGQPRYPEIGGVPMVAPPLRSQL